MPEDPYRTLDVSKDASDAEIKRSYRKLARQYHPDRNPGDAAAEERFKAIQSAYESILPLLIMRYIERTLSSKEKSQSLSSQSNTVP